MNLRWHKFVPITASRSESGCIELRITMGLTGPRLVLKLGDEHIVLASKWQSYTTEHGNKALIAAINEGVQALKGLPDK